MKKRNSILIGNWKMHKTTVETALFIEQCRSRIISQSVDIYLAVPFTALKTAAEAAEGSSIVIGAQNVYDADEGAFTGEVSVPMLCDVGAQFVILGHSERRNLFFEDDRLINRKVLKVIEHDLQPVLCVGETAEQHQEGIGEIVVREQLLRCLQGVTEEQMHSLMIAYEPVWAIGTGMAATPLQVEEMHRMCRSIVHEEWGERASQEMRILYGGSVQPTNVSAFVEKPNVDGVLVGSAALSLATFVQIVNNIAIPN